MQVFYAHKILLSWLLTMTAMDWKKDFMMYYVISVMDEMSLLGEKNPETNWWKKLAHGTELMLDWLVSEVVNQTELLMPFS